MRKHKNVPREHRKLNETRNQNPVITCNEKGGSVQILRESRKEIEGEWDEGLK